MPLKEKNAELVRKGRDPLQAGREWTGIMEKIIFETDDGEKLELFIEEETRVGGTDYILVTDSDADEANAYILKDISGDGEPMAEFVMVEDDVEFEAIAKIFEQMLEDTDFS